MSYYDAEVVTANDYYPFGLTIAALSSKKLGDALYEGHLENNNLYNDKELFEDGDLDWYDYGFRNYDPQIGRFPQLDPLTWDYPELTNYQYAGNEPIANVDLDGLEKLDILQQGACVFSSGASTASTTASLTGAVALGAARTSALRVVGQGAKVVAMNVAKRPSLWATIVKAVSSSLPYLARVGGTAVGVFIPTPTGAGASSVPRLELVPGSALHPETNPKPDNDDDDDNNDKYLYRGGAFTDVNFTPKEKDTEDGPKQGWSTFTTPGKATQGQGGKYQVLSLKRLIKFGFSFNFTSDGHVGIVPKSKKALKAWAATKEPLKAGKRSAHLLTRILKKARVREGKI